MSDITERDVQVMQTGRLLRAEADIILPMLAERREAAIARMLVYYRGNEHEKITACVGEICVTEDMKQTIKNKIKLAEQVERKAHNGNNE